jgi:hypothetical protein
MTGLTEFPGRPRVVKGALWVYDDQQATQPSRQILFQYNPENVRRTFAVRTPPRDASQSGAAHESVLNVPGPPVETLTLTIELDAADQLEDPKHRDQVNSAGLYGALAALELLLYPSTARISQITRQADQGAVDVHPADTPLVLLHWGTSRVVPVQLMSLSITEELFDPALNPIQAKVDLGLKVLTYMEFTSKSVAREASIAHQKTLEQLAQQWVGG